MEIKANFLLIGAFTLLGLAMILGAFLWLGALRVDRDVTRYGVLFEDVSGLSKSGEVIFNGLSVGRVVEVRLHDADPSVIYVAIEIDAATPIRADTVAELTAQAVTGVSHVALIGGTQAAPPLAPSPSGPPLIPSRRTGLQTLMADIPGLVEEAQALIADLRIMTGSETQAQVQSILANSDAATAKLNTALDGLSDLTTGLSDAAEQIGGLGQTVAALEGDLRGTLGRADAALVSVTDGFEAARPVIGEVSSVAAAARVFISEDATAAVASWDLAGQQFTPTLRRFDEAMIAFETASSAIEALTAGDATTLLSQAQDAVAAAGPAIRDDLPAALSDLRLAAADTKTALRDASDGLLAASAQLDPLATEAREAVAAASSVLEGAKPTLEGLDSAIASADATFAAATQIIEQDIGPAMGDIRAASTAVARDLPQLTRQANTVLGEIAAAVAAVTPGLRTFGANTLPEYGRLASDARSLIRSISTFVRQIERDPVGVLQGARVPEYRR